MHKKVVFPSFWTLLILAFFSSLAQGQNLPNQAQEQWVDSVFNSLDQNQRIGQLLMVATYSNKTETHARQIESLINKYGLGGLIFFQGTPAKQASLTNRYQAQSKTPLLIGIDGEWGLGMRLDGVLDFPYQMTMGAMEAEDEQLIYKMGREIARQCRLMGIHVDFAPVVDINSDPANPVIGRRSFGEDKENVARKSISYIAGLQDGGVIASAKHFPGHGDTGTDSHVGLPVIKHDTTRLISTELYPFRKTLESGVMSVMVGHINVPALDPEPGRPASLSPKIVNGWLKERMGFKGLVFTDALNMQGVAKNHKSGEIEVKAIKAGNDVLLFPQNVGKAIEAIKKAVRDGEISQETVDKKVRKILYAKYWAGLDQNERIDVKSLKTELGRPVSGILTKRIYESAITVVRNKGDYLPLRMPDTTTIASLSLNAGKQKTAFQTSAERYATVKHFNLSRDDFSNGRYKATENKLSGYETVLVEVHGMTRRRGSHYGLDTRQLDMLERLRKKGKKVVVVLYGSPYALKYVTGFDHIICAYEDNGFMRQASAEVVFGSLPGKGTIPVSACEEFPVGTGVKTPALGRLGYATPEEVGMDSKVLKKIDKLAIKAVRTKATPGCQVLVAKDGKVVFEKGYGTYTYGDRRPVTRESVYDVASVTKVAATLQAAMLLEGHGLININDKASKHLPEMVGTNKEDVTIVNMLTHQAGLYPYKPFWARTIQDSVKNVYYRSKPSDKYSIKVATGMYGLNSLPDSVWRWTLDCEMRKPQRKSNGFKYNYKYSDQSFYILRRIVEKKTNQPLDQFMDQNFYRPLSLNRTGFLAWDKFDKKAIVPSERDNYFRNGVLQGYVNDPVAALNGGVDGHAGLFSNAYGMAVMLQMCLQDGYYGGYRFYPKNTVAKFTSSPFMRSNGNRRGIGWDKPVVKGDGPTSSRASKNAFGHLGFTGTTIWADPDHNLVYVFLSNRVYPSNTNKKLIKQNIRTHIQDVVYESIYEMDQKFPAKNGHSAR
ncbi:beta-N-acetylglucosaminidase [Fulvitalea axinellae]|uniref:beta-N-acetylhexosaminidase n=1 Tax=Fulvitalea axinellae TaxID=1182444 RepID=A0AAU9DI20_9BACT|nr:beta-N-acetylglucosaminidase [Fulvitalea axinellae]